MARHRWFIQDKLSQKFVITFGIEWEELIDDIDHASYWTTKKGATYVMGVMSELFPKFHNIKVDLQVIRR